ncbi:helix-turn-helix domain-containing protein [Zhihengliuella halotolerans]|uniref:helix-turn-helix domain-containing protein n=1 Tax=Zhihengliuella halotolerans TaxID=370736 RepID=UPI0011AF42DC|nr:helix-turn-helix domain-containing protein [Zhihengliuella halotolerans]
MERLMDVKQTAKVLGMRPETVREMLRTEELAGIKGAASAGSGKSKRPLSSAGSGATDTRLGKRLFNCSPAG